MRLDAHQHFWRFDPIGYPWIHSDWPIRRDFLPAELHGLLSPLGFEGSIAVQARQSLEETGWLLDLADRHPMIKGVVGWVDLCSDNVEEDLARLAERPRIVGVRHVLQDEPDDGFMLRPAFICGISKLAQFDLTYDLLIFARQLPAAIRLVSQFPDQPFVLDHLAKPEIKLGKISQWREDLIELGKAPNIMCKLSGLITEANWATWKKAEFQPYLEAAFEAFGVDRLMFGSDWPVCLLAGTYEEGFDIVQQRLAMLPSREREQILGGNAERFYFRRSSKVLR